MNLRRDHYRWLFSHNTVKSQTRTGTTSPSTEGSPAFTSRDAKLAEKLER